MTGAGALVLIAAAWLRGAEYDEQYTLFLTAGVPRPAWPEIAFPAGLAREFQSGRADFAGIGRDLRIADVHPPLYFWLMSLWRAALGDGLFAARLFSVGCGVAALTLTGAIARRVAVSPAWAMLFTLGCYAFTYTSCIARGFALAQLLLLGGVFALLGRGRRGWMGGAMLGAATLTNYLAVFPAMACLAMAGWSRGADRAWRGACVGYLVFLPADAWWFLAQRGSRADQFPPFALLTGLAMVSFLYLETPLRDWILRGRRRRAV